MLKTLIVEDNERLQHALCAGLEATGQIKVNHAVMTGEDALEYCLNTDISARCNFDGCGACWRDEWH